MDSWRTLACYPWRTFDPLSDSSSTRRYRVTITYFRTSSTCRSYCQASLYYYALKLVYIQLELTFVRFRYSLESGRPSQTARLSRFLRMCRLEKKQSKGWYFTDVVLNLFKTAQLPPILHSESKSSMTSYSKGAQGLTVFF